LTPTKAAGGQTSKIPSVTWALAKAANRTGAANRGGPVSGGGRRAGPGTGFSGARTAGFMKTMCSSGRQPSGGRAGRR
jgi:hypothetical protein